MWYGSLGLHHLFQPILKFGKDARRFRNLKDFPRTFNSRTLTQCNGLNVYVPPSYVELVILCDGISRWGFGEVIGHEDRALMSETGALKKGT